MGPVVFLDPGHGGYDPGAVGPSGLRESDMTLDVCLRAKDLLQSHGIDCRLTRYKDVYISLKKRAALANGNSANAFVSYHFNSASGAVPPSWEVFSTPGQNNSDRLATLVGEEHASLFPDQIARTDFSDGDIDKEANFTVLRHTDHPSCLIEGEFIHTIEGERRISILSNRQKMAKAVCLGVLKFFKMPYQPKELTLAERITRLEQHAGISHG